MLSISQIAIWVHPKGYKILTDLSFKSYSWLGLFIVCVSWYISKILIKILQKKERKIRNELFLMMFSMSPGNLSIIYAVLQGKEDAGIGTVIGTENDRFYSLMERLGYAEREPSKKDISPELEGLMKDLRYYKISSSGRVFLENMFRAYEDIKAHKGLQ